MFSIQQSLHKMFCEAVITESGQSRVGVKSETAAGKHKGIVAKYYLISAMSLIV